MKPFQGTLATVVTAGTAVSPSLAIPDNCHTVIVVNQTAAIGYVAWCDVAASFLVATAVPIPAGASVSLAVGPRSKRPQTGVGATADSLFFDASANATVLNVVYVNGIEA